MTSMRAPVGSPRIGVIDVGSNSVRLVVYYGLSRNPAVLFNEKVMAGLGRGLVPGGRLAADAMDMAVAAMLRFALLCEAMEVDSIRAVATAAVRSAVNGPEFIERVRRETGIAVEIIDGRTEACSSAYGLLMGIPDADGVMGDFGGGSLELVHVSGGRVHEHLSLPLGSLRLGALHRESKRRLQHEIDRALRELPPEFGEKLGRGKPFYAVGGSWRALAQLHMQLIEWPLPVVHEYRMAVDATDRLVRTLAHISVKALKAMPSVSSSRAPELPAAAVLLRAVARKLGSDSIIASAFGLREGLLFQSMPAATYRQDPLLAGAREAALRTGRFSDDNDIAAGDALLGFSDGLFPDEPPSLRRLRHAACLLADTSWRAHPDMRAEDAMDLALHSTWGGIDAAGRAMLAYALWTVNGGSIPGPHDEKLARLADAGQLQLARRWGLALRLGQRLGGGVAAPLLAARLVADRKTRLLWLSLPPGQAAFYGPSVARRHRALAQAMDLTAEFRQQDPDLQPAFAS